MHTAVEPELERYLAGRPVSQAFRDHMGACGECRAEIELFSHQARLIRTLRTHDVEMAPAAGFYARVMERVEATIEAAPPSIWTIFLQPFGQRLAFGSLALFVVLSGVLLTVPDPVNPAAAPQAILADETVVPSVVVSHRITGNQDADRAAVLTQLATFEQ